MPFTPNDVAQVSLWYEAGLSESAAVDGQKFSGINDLSPTGNHATQATASKQFIYHANGGPSNLPWWEGPATSFYALASQQVIKRFYIVAWSPNATWAFGAWMGGASSSDRSMLFNTSTSAFFAGTVGAVSQNDVPLASAVNYNAEPITDPAVFVVDCNQPTLLKSWYLNGDSAGANAAAMNYFLVIGVSDIPSAGDHQALMDYCAAKLPARGAALPDLPAGLPTGCKSFIRADKSYSDFYRTTPATDGQEVKSVKDQTGNSVDWIKSKATGPTYKASGFNGLPALRFSNNYLSTPNRLENDYTGSWSFVIAYYDDPATETATQTLIHRNAQTAALYYFETSNKFGRLSQSQVIQYGPKIAVVTYDSATTTERIYVNGSRIHQNTVSLTWGRNQAWMLGNGPSNTPFKGDIYAYGSWARALSESEAIAATEAVSTLIETQPRIVLTGNSIMDGTQAYVTNNAIAQVRAAVDAQVHIAKRTHSGATWPNLFTYQPYEVNLMASVHQRTVLLGWESTNWTGHTAQEHFEKTRDYCLAAKAAGIFKVAAVTVLPATSLTEATRLAANQLIRDGWQAFADYLVDLGGDALMGQTGDNLNTTYYNDGVHPTQAGQDRIATVYLIPWAQQALLDAADTDAPAFLSAATNSAGTQITVLLTEAQSPAMIGDTGFVVVEDGVTRTLSSQTPGTASVVLAISGKPLEASSGAITVAYAPGNFTDAAFNPLVAFGAQPVTNNSTYALPEPPDSIESDTGQIEVVLDWTAVTGAASYNIYRDGVLHTTSATNSKTVLENSNESHVYAVSSVDAYGQESDLSDEITQSTASGGTGTVNVVSRSRF